MSNPSREASSEKKAAFERIVRQLEPKHAVVLGSGLGQLPRSFQSLGSFLQADVAEIPRGTVAGHAGLIEIGRWSGKPTLVCLGRVHGYEGRTPREVVALMDQLPRWGVESLLLFNATGGIHPELEPGDPVLITDYWEATGPFWNLGASGPVWSIPNGVKEAGPSWCRGLKRGRFVMLRGPNYETPAEVRALKALGADVVGMSSAWELDAAKELGLATHLVSVIANHACGLKEEALSHADVCAVMARSVGKIHEVIDRWID